MEKFKSLMRIVSVAALLGVALGTTGCATDGKLRVGEEVEIGRTTFSEDATDEYMLFPDYRISPGDVLDVLYQVRSWEEQPNFKIAVDHVVSVRFIHYPEFSETQAVRPDGNISLAYLGSVRVTGKTVEALTEELKTAYRKYLKDPELYVVLEEFRGAIKELKTDLRTAPRGLSRLVTVRPDGYATFAMVGDLAVAGNTIPDMAKVLNERYQSILPGLSADLFLEKHSGSRIYVFGEVNQPGAFEILRPTSIFEAVAMAGSIKSSARIDSAIVFRQKKDKLLATRIDLKKIMIPSRGEEVERYDEDEAAMGDTELAYNALSGEEDTTSPEYRMAQKKMFYLHPNDIIYIPRRRLNSAAEIAREVADIFFFRGWSIGFSGDYNLN
ncbi:MAG: polysaccharide biosynthesis/export family protein [Verrucomicrobia bacterium]|nr:polysaccharide biosynthesis/export family protein [Verrucomicrobiota bacterium]